MDWFLYDIGLHHERVNDFNDFFTSIFIDSIAILEYYFVNKNILTYL